MNEKLFSRLVVIRQNINLKQIENDNIYPFVLNSLFHACKIDPKKSFNYCQKLSELSSKRQFKLYIDSGGYSIIAGLIEENQIDELIQTYYTFAKSIRENTIDYIFSLDIPFSLKYTRLNQRNKIFKYNKSVQERYIEIAQQNSHYRNKALFVWQWKTMNLFDIWYQIFTDLELYKFYDYYSIGGLVGLKQMQKLNHSPYIVPLLFIFSVIRNYYDDNQLKSIAQRNNNKYFFHILGQGGSLTEHMLVPIIEKFLEIIFNFPVEIFITFDTASIEINFTNIKNMPLLISENDQVKLTGNIPKEIIDRDTGRVVDVDKAKYLLYQTRMYLEQYFINKYLKQIIEMIMNISNQMQMLKYTRALVHALQKDKIFSLLVGPRNINDFIISLTYLIKYKLKYVDSNEHYDIDKNKELLKQYIKNVIRLPEIIK